MKKKANKGRPTSIRLLPETEKTLMRCPGKSLTDKFEYLVDFCMKREEILAKVEKEYHERFRAYEEQINQLEQLLGKLMNSTNTFDLILNDLKQVCKNDNTE